MRRVEASRRDSFYIVNWTRSVTSVMTISSVVSAEPLMLLKNARFVLSNIQFLELKRTEWSKVLNGIMTDLQYWSVRVEADISVRLLLKSRLTGLRPLRTAPMLMLQARKSR